MRHFLLIPPLLLIWLHALGQDGVGSSITVESDFNPSWLDSIEVSLLCSTGSLQKTSYTVGADERVVITPPTFEEGKTYCQVRTQPPSGYSVSYAAAGKGKHIADRNGCQFSPLAPGPENHCVIEVAQNPVTLTVFKEWIGGSTKDESVRVTLSCESGEWSGPILINEGSPGSWEIRDIDSEGILCNVSEEVRDTFRPDIIDCQGLLILPGKGEECTLVNTRIVKRIEMLNRYGKVIMILLVLAVGLIAARRLS